MSKTMRARFVNGRLEPEGHLDLTEGEEVIITIVEPVEPKNRDLSRRAAGSWKETVSAEDLIRNIYADRLLGSRQEPRL